MSFWNGTMRNIQMMKTKSEGRPPIYSEKMKQTAIFLPLDMIEWLRQKPGTMSENVRQIIADAMKAPNS